MTVNEGSVHVRVGGGVDFRHDSRRNDFGGFRVVGCYNAAIHRPVRYFKSYRPKRGPTGFSSGYIAFPQDLSLVVEFVTGPSQTFDQAHFTLSSDGLSFNGNDQFDLHLAPIVSATLTGLFSTTSITLSDGTTATISPDFTANITDASGVLKDQDLAIINATTGTSPSGVPEPGSAGLTALGLGAALLWKRKQMRGALGRLRPGTNRGLQAGLLVACLLALPAMSRAQVHLSTWTVPDNGVAGISQVNVTGSSFPTGTIPAGNVTVSLAPTCGAAGTSAAALSVITVLGTVRRVEFQVPGTLANGTYAASLSGKTSGGTSFSSTNCASVKVTHTNPTLASCIPTSSLAVLQGKNVVAYVPNGAWGAFSTGIQAVPLEGAGSPVSIPTTSAVNSCSANSATGETVCTGNNTDVFLITGTSITNTLTSGSNSFAGFSGGSCKNCGVAIDATANRAFIAMGLSGSSSGDGIQLLNLATNAFSTPSPTVNVVSEDVSIDPSRHLILSPGERGVYTLYQVSASTGALTEFSNNISGGLLDSAAEDCTTGIALSTREGTLELFLADLTQATLTPGSPAGTWTAPGQFQTFPEFSGMGAGTCGISVAPGSSHLGIVAGEFGSNRIGVIKLPSTSGSGTPGVVDYAAFNLPAEPNGATFSLGFDPHTVTAYTSPNNGKAYGVAANSPPPSFLAVVDLAAALAAPRTAGTHNIDPTYNLITNGVVRYVATH